MSEFEFDLVLPSGLEVLVVIHSIQSAEPDVGIMRPYCDNWEVLGPNGEDLTEKLSKIDDEFLQDKMGERADELYYNYEGDE